MPFIKEIARFLIVIGLGVGLFWLANFKRVKISSGKVLKVPVFIKIIVVSLFACFSFVLLRGAEGGVQYVMSFLMILFVGWFLIKDISTQIVVSNEFILKRNIFSEVKIKWTEILDVGESGFDYSFYVRCHNSDVIKISYLIAGAIALKNEIRRRLLIDKFQK